MSRYILLCEDGTARRTDNLTKQHLREAKKTLVIFDAEQGREMSPDTKGKREMIPEESAWEVDQCLKKKNAS